MAWLLASACLLHHAVHWLGGAAPRWLHALASTPVHAALSALALLGPGRGIIREGFKALAHGAPDMNSLVGLGATASFAVSAVAALLPKLGERRRWAQGAGGCWCWCWRRWLCRRRRLCLARPGLWHLLALLPQPCPEPLPPAQPCLPARLPRLAHLL